MSKKINILVVGQIPPPYHGQAISTKRFLEGSYDHANLNFVKISLSTSLKEVGKFRLKKLFKIFIYAIKILLKKVQSNSNILYYMPSGGQKIGLYKDFILLSLTRWAFKKTIFHFRSAGLSTVYDDLGGLKKAVFRFCYNKPDVTIRLSRLNPEDGKFLNSKLDVVIGNGMEDYASAYKKNESDVVSILYIGSIRKTKGVGELLHATEYLKENNLKFRLSLVGGFHDVEFRSFVTDFIEKNDDCINYLGELHGGDKWQKFADTDILVFPSYYENESFGLVLIEAMQFSIPVVATDWRALPDIVQDEKTGYIVPIKDSKNLGLRLEELIIDENLRVEMGKQARKVYEEKYTLEKFYDHFDQLFKVIKESA